MGICQNIRALNKRIKQLDEDAHRCAKAYKLFLIKASNVLTKGNSIWATPGKIHCFPPGKILPTPMSDARTKHT